MDKIVAMIIYKITNKINNKIYIGKDSKNNEKYFGSGKLLKQAIKLYGKENFIKETIEVCETIEILNIREIFWIEFYQSTNKKIGYNLAKGGTGGKTREVPWNKGKKLKPLTEETKQKLSKANKGRKYSKELKDKMSKSMKGIKKSKEHREKLSKANLGKKLTQETKNKMSKARKGICQKILTCPHCGKQGGTTMYRWHFNNCKNYHI